MKLWFYHAILTFFSENLAYLSAILNICLASLHFISHNFKFISCNYRFFYFLLHGSNKLPYHARHSFHQNIIVHIFLTFFSKNVFILMKWKGLNSKCWCHDETLCAVYMSWSTFDLFSLMHFSFRLDLIHKELIESMEEELNI